MGIRLGIVGFGRIGRSIFRLGYDMPGVEFAVICDSSDPEALTYLLNNSTIEGKFEGAATLEGNHILCGSQKARLLGEFQPGLIPWDIFEVDVVLECTGRFRSRSELSKHIDAGAGAVLLSTPALDEVDATIVRGINCKSIKGSEQIISCGSSSIHALGLMAQVLNNLVPIELGTMTTVHAYTGDQRLSDMARKELRWSRSAAQNIIPNATWATEELEALIPEFAGKFQGLALNVPVPAGSNIDLVTKLSHPTSVEEINSAFKRASQNELEGLMRYTEEPIVSSDAIGDTHSVIIDATATISMEGGLSKTLGWFDNGWAYASRMLETALLWGQAKKGGN